ncbi:MAG TPA: hypothetical protein PK177_09765 [Burkholderiaceae bacterium]|nr:hypothetical protein [Burkholderiaceae bacterium]
MSEQKSAGVTKGFIRATLLQVIHPDLVGLSAGRMEEIVGKPVAADEDPSADLERQLGVRDPSYIVRSLLRLNSRDRRRIEEEQGRPECFDSEEVWHEWKKAARISPVPVLHGYCHDCTVDHRDAMVEAGRCAWPNTEFIGLDGYRVFVQSKPSAKGR